MMNPTRRHANGEDDSHYFTSDGHKYRVDDRARPIPDLDLSSITEVRHKKWVFHRPPPKRFALKWPLIIITAICFGYVGYELIF